MAITTTSTRRIQKSSPTPAPSEPTSIFVVLNFSTDALTYKLPGATKAGDLVISNLGKTTESGDTLHLKGWEARVYRY